MINHFSAKLLTDKSRLPEIYKLRVLCWENSEQKEFVNQKLFPNGWKDILDDDAYHWIIEDGERIICSARICILNDIKEIPEDYAQFTWPAEKPFAFISRLVVHPEYRSRGLVHIMDKVRLSYLTEYKIPFAVMDVDERRLKTLYKLGFREVGILKSNYADTPLQITTVIRWDLKA